MLDIKFIRQNPQVVKDGCQKKQVKVDIDQLLEVDKRRRESLQALEDMLAQKNKASKIIAKTKDKKEKQKLILEMRELDINSDRLNQTLKNLNSEFNALILQIPNLPLEDVPPGKDESDNKEISKWGKIPKFDFEPKDHLELGKELDLIDVERAAKVAGTRLGYLKNEAVLLEFALENLAVNILIKEGFRLVDPPMMIKKEMMQGMGYVERGKEEIYYLKDDPLCLIGTSEQSIGVMHTDEIFEEKELPKRYLGFSYCFRREAGSYGKDTKGIFRVHQFYKVEMFSFCHPERSKDEHKFFLSLEEKLMQSLKLSYRVVQICSGDLGDPAAAKYDIEAWIPSQGRFRETHSTSNCTDFQTRRLNIRYRNNSGKLNFVHTINGTAFATGRILIAILENYQQKDGSVLIPEVLQKYTGFEKIYRKI